MSGVGEATELISVTFSVFGKHSETFVPTSNPPYLNNQLFNTFLLRWQECLSVQHRITASAQLLNYSLQITKKNY